MIPRSHRVQSVIMKCVLAIVFVTGLGLGLIYVARQHSSTIPQPAKLSSPALPVRRVISISPSATEIIFALGAGERLVGVDRFSTFPPEVVNIPRVGGLEDPDLERIAALEPDLLILRGGNDSVERLCLERGIRIYRDPTNTLDDLYRTLEELGGLLDRLEAAREINARLQGSFEEVRSRVAGLPRVKVLFVISRSIDRLANVYTVGRRSFLSSIIDIAGGKGAFDTEDVDYLEVTPEAILAADPEVIIDAMPGQDFDADQRAALIAQWNDLGDIRAVRNHRVILVTDTYITIPSPRLERLARDIADWLHPRELETRN